jgi:hypothetical protein
MLRRRLAGGLLSGPRPPAAGSRQAGLPPRAPGCYNRLMGIELLVSRSAPFALSPLLEALAAVGLASEVVMVDGALVDPRRPPPERWRDVRLKTPAGTVALSARPGGVAVVVFGNADGALLAAQQRIAALLGAP